MKKLLVAVFLLFASQAHAARPVLLWNTTGDQASFKLMRDALEKAGGHPIHAFPSYFLAGYFEDEQISDLPFAVSIIHAGDDLQALGGLSREAQGFASAWARMIIKKTEPRMIPKDLPPIINDVIRRESDERRTPSLPSRVPPYGGDLEDTSLFMIGDISVSVIFPESNDSICVTWDGDVCSEYGPDSEDWTDEEIANVKAEIICAMDWWAAREPDAHLTFVYNYEERIPSPYDEPIQIEGQGYCHFWIADVMEYLGYGPWHVPADPQVYDYLNDQRDLHETDWAVAVFVVDSSNDEDGSFADGCFAFAYLDGPFLVMTYDNDGYGINNMDAVAAHETGHIFGALDEYKPCDCTDKWGHLYIANQNCNNFCSIDEVSIMRGGIVPFTNGLIDYYARGQIGWRDTDADNILDIEDTNPEVNVVLPDTQTTLSFQVHGSSAVTWLPSPNPYHSDVSINTIAEVQYRVDGGSWLDGTADDGDFDEPVEAITLSVTVDSGAHTLECRAISDVGNMTDPVYQGEFIINPPACSVDPATVDFGTVVVGGTKDTTITITNTGGMTLSGTVSETCDHYSIVLGGGAYSLTNGQSHLVTVRFEPAATGTHVCVIETGDALCGDVSCTGAGDVPPACSVDPAAVDFGTVLVGGTKDTTITITNTGGFTLSGTASETCDHYSIVAGGGAYNLTNGQSHLVTVRFEPAATGTHGCVIETGDALCGDVSCTGAGDVPPVCVVDPDTLQFGTIALDDSLELEFIITNTGGGTLVGSASEVCDHYSIVSGGGAYVLGNDDTVHVVVRFKPTVTGEHVCSIETGTPDCVDVFCIGTRDDLTGIGTVQPLAFDLYQNYPNPFKSETRIQFSLDQEGSVVLSIYDIAGKHVRTLANRGMTPGIYTEEWDGRDSAGNTVASGIYFYQLKMGTRIVTRKAVLLK